MNLEELALIVSAFNLLWCIFFKFWAEYKFGKIEKSLNILWKFLPPPSFSASISHSPSPSPSPAPEPKPPWIDEVNP